MENARFRPRQPNENWEILVAAFLRSRRINMSRALPFVKHVNTIYCAPLLGHSQDVDECGSLWKRTGTDERRSGRRGGFLTCLPDAQAGCLAGFVSSRRLRKERGCPREEQSRCH